MKRLLPLAAAALCMSVAAFAEEPGEAEETVAADEAATEKNGDGVNQPKAMSGMSILGNEEAPKSLVIVPWKSSELGDNISLSDTLDDRARPVDKEVFLRQLHFYEIRAGKSPDQG
jgi:hypothetical protein